MQEDFNKLSAAKTVAGLNDRVQEMERITALHSHMASASSDSNSKLSKLKTLTPTESYKPIATPARKCESHEELLQTIEARMIDPFTGMARG